MENQIRERRGLYQRCPSAREWFAIAEGMTFCGESVADMSKEELLAVIGFYGLEHKKSFQEKQKEWALRRVKASISRMNELSKDEQK